MDSKIFEKENTKSILADSESEKSVSKETVSEEPMTNEPVYDVVIIGGGPAGLAAAVAAYDSLKNGRILIVERDRALGGILNQCIHNGFGLHTFKEELTGPEYAARFIDLVKERNIEYKLCTMVIDISIATGNEYKKVMALNSKQGLFYINARTIILAMGCRERARGQLNIPGYRPAGIYSAGTAQRLINLDGLMPGKEVVILGSGDIGLIMARRMTLEGAKVKVVAELMPYSGGLKRNIVQCLDDFNIPLKLSHTVTDIKGTERVEGVTLSRVDEYAKPIPGTEEDYTCDTLLLSCGLIPENELTRTAGISINPVTSGPIVNESMETDYPGVFACGNVLHVHDLVDFVSEEAARAGKNAAKYISCPQRTSQNIKIIPSHGIRYTVPSFIRQERVDDDIVVRFRVDGVYKNCFIDVMLDDKRIIHKKRQIVTPGEMENITLNRTLLSENVSQIAIILTET